MKKASKTINKTLNPNQLLVLNAYSNGYFPMGKENDNINIEWVKPRLRGLLPLGKLYCSKSLKKVIKRNEHEISFNENFNAVIDNCANRKYTWINSTIRDLFIDFHKVGLAHSVEVKKNSELVGGLYGLSIGSIFFAESMFSLISNASKLALLAMMARINYGGYKVLDTQFPSKHLSSLGGFAIKNKDFQDLLQFSFDQTANFNRNPRLKCWDQYLQYGSYS